MPTQSTAPPATERTLRAQLAFRIDPRGISQLSVGGSEIEKALENVDNILANTEQDATAMEEAFLSLAGSLQIVGTREANTASANLEKMVEQFNRGKLGVEDMTAALDEMETTIVSAVVFQELQAELQQLRADAALASEELQDLSNTVQALESVGMEIAGMARMVTDPLRTFAQRYVDTVGKSEAASRKWLEATEDLEAAQTKLGGVAVESILPLMELTADVMEKAAEFAEAHPELVQAVFGIGTAMILANSLQAAVSKGIRLIADAKLVIIETKRFLAAQMNRQAADKMLAAATLNQRAATTQAAGGAGTGVRGAVGALGGLGGVAGALTVTAAVVAWGAVALKVKSLGDDAKKKTAEMEDHWDRFLDNASKSTMTATELADEYNAAQNRVNAAYNEGGIVAQVMFDREKLVNADRAKLSQALTKQARSYEDFQQAVTRLNNMMGQGEEQIVMVSEATFDYRRKLAQLRDEYKRGEAGLRDIAQAQLESGNAVEAWTGAITMSFAKIQERLAAKELADAWGELHDTIDGANERFADETGDAWTDFLNEREKAEEEKNTELERIQDEYNRNVLQMDLDHNTAREQIVAEAGQEIVRKESDIAEQRQEAMTDFRVEMDEAEDDYYADRAERAADFGLEMQRAEQDHQIAMRRMREDSAVRQTQAVRSRDAVALREERRSYEVERQRSEEDFMLDMGRRNQDYARQIAQMEVAFRQQQAARQAAYEQQIIELKRREAEEIAVLEAGTEERLNELDEQRQRDIRGLHDNLEEQQDATNDHWLATKRDQTSAYQDRREDARRAQRREIQDANDAWTQRRQNQGVFLTGEIQELNAHYNRRLASLQAWMVEANAVIQAGTTVPLPGRAGGGYMNAGVYRVGERGYEFAMDNPTTRMAEGLANGNLTQAGLRGMMGGGRTIEFSQSVVIQDGRDPEKTAALVRRETLTALHEILKEVK